MAGSKADMTEKCVKGILNMEVGKADPTEDCLKDITLVDIELYTNQFLTPTS